VEANRGQNLPVSRLVGAHNCERSLADSCSCSNCLLCGGGRVMRSRRSSTLGGAGAATPLLSGIARFCVLTHTCLRQPLAPPASCRDCRRQEVATFRATQRRLPPPVGPQGLAGGRLSLRGRRRVCVCVRRGCAAAGDFVCGAPGGVGAGLRARPQRAKGLEFARLAHWCCHRIIAGALANHYVAAYLAARLACSIGAGRTVKQTTPFK